MLKEAKEEELKNVEVAFSKKYAYDAVSFEGNNHITLEEVDTLFEC